MTDLAPIVLFAYNRPEHTARTLEALARNALAEQSHLTIYCDGPRADADVESTQRVRDIASKARGFRSVDVIERSDNMGLAKSVIAGVSAALDKNETVIVLEDDLLTSPHFLTFMNEGLLRYADADRVISICGYTFPVNGELPDAFFLPGAFCWGWATWRRGWALYEHDAAHVLDELERRNLIYEFDFKGTDPLTRILQRAVLKEGRVDSWALRWMGAACLHGKLTLYPGRSLVANKGFDGSGVHAHTDRRFESPMAERCPLVASTPVALDKKIIDLHRALFSHWRMEGGAGARLYYRLMSFVPDRVEKLVYSAIIKRYLRRHEAAARQASGGEGAAAPATD